MCGSMAAALHTMAHGPAAPVQRAETRILQGQQRPSCPSHLNDYMCQADVDLVLNCLVVHRYYVAFHKRLRCFVLLCAA